MTESPASWNEDRFWAVIACLDWDQTGDDDAVIASAVAMLADAGPDGVRGFEETLARRLHALDGQAWAAEIGEEA